MDGVCAHRAALVASGRCPACAERLRARALFGRAPCSTCGVRVADVGVDGSQATAHLERRGTKTIVVAGVAAGLVQLVVGWIPLADVLVAVGIAGWLRLAILGPATAMMSPTRRVVTRGTARLMVGAMLAVLLVFSELLTLVGPFGLPFKAVLSALQVFIGAFVVTRYTEAQLRREQQGRPVEPSEYALLILTLVGLLVAVAGLTFAALWVMQAVQSFLGGVQPGGHP